MINANRVVQTNLQVLDTPLMNPRELVGAVADLGANALLFNVGGIYAWYPTEVPFHTVNPHLPAEGDLLASVIAECHQRGMKFIARFDFSRAEDLVYYQRPWWFVKSASGEPQVKGALRPGKWPILMTTCVNGGYRSADVAIPILREVLGRYGIDGVFLNSPTYTPCFCETCRDKYAMQYGSQLPDRIEDFDPGWADLCVLDNICLLHQAIQAERADVPLFLYYWAADGKLAYRMEVADELCTEPQDVLSLGHLHIPDIVRPITAIKKGRTVQDRMIPYGIVHSSPGMDWRHTGLPTAEYEYWMSLIPASGGNLWCSLTGFDRTITDKRILRSVTRMNQRIQCVEKDMDDAVTCSDVVLLWDASRSADGLALGLIQRQIPFDLILNEQLSADALRKYRLLILPEHAISDANIDLFTAYVQAGGRLLVEGATCAGTSTKVQVLLGITGPAYRSGELLATYLRFEAGLPGDADEDICRLRHGFEETELLALRGVIHYVFPGKTAKVLLTQVPPFSPLESVGVPPERASLLLDRTDIPLLVLNRIGTGKVMYLPFSLSRLIDEFRLAEHFNLFSNMIDVLLDGTCRITVTQVQGLYVSVFKKGETLLVHLVNGVGTRPLVDAIPLHDLTITIRLQDPAMRFAVTALISGESLPCDIYDSLLVIHIPRLDVWECVKIEPAGAIVRW